jgi:outer membrane protein insertion porin family
VIFFTWILQHRARVRFFSRIAIVLATLALQQGAFAQPSAGLGGLIGRPIASIEVKGLKRLEKEAILGKIGSKVGQPLSRTQVRSDIQALFGMGYFDDIEVQATPEGGGAGLSYVVRERPVIARIEFDGNERLSTTDLKDVIRVKEFSILDVNKIKEDVALLQKHYEEKGFYLAKITYELKRLKGDEVELTYRINDYEKIQIKQITFLNNKQFSDEQLKGILAETKEGSFFSFISGAGSFKESAFKQDLQRLMIWYLEHGYVKFRYENPVVTVTNDKKWLYISIYVEEGEKYEIGTIDFGGDLLFPKDELHTELTLKSGDTFSISKRNQDIQRLTEKYQDLGYAFVNVVPRMNFRDEVKLVDLEYSFEKGELVYFGEINILGNAKTYDYVIRRELRMREGELYNGTNLRKSRENVERLGFFAPGEVLFNTTTPKGKLNVLNVEISVKERSTGTITLGAGFGSVQGFFFTGQISEINLFGRGQNLTLSAQYSTQNLAQNFNLGFTDPYAFDTRWSLGGDIYYVAFPIPGRYTSRKTGGDIRVGHPVAEYVQAFLTYKLENLLPINAAEGIPQSEIDADNGILSSLVFSVVRDKRNNRFETTEGNYQSVTLETAGLGGQKSFVKSVMNNRFYFRIVGDLVFRNSTEFGQILGLGGAPIPPSEKFFLGGPNNMKGFQLFSLGPSRTVVPSSGGAPFSQPIGGTTEFFSLFEVEYPILREAGIKAVLFFDAGNNWATFPSTNFGLLADAGFGFRWFSPIGPLRFEWGYPISGGPPVFQFFIGPPF